MIKFKFDEDKGQIIMEMQKIQSLIVSRKRKKTKKQKSLNKILIADDLIPYKPHLQKGGPKEKGALYFV